MKPPRSVLVGPHTYQIRTIPDGVLASAGNVGQHDAPRGVIALCGDQTRSQIADSLLHELGHALLASVGLEDEIEERVCLALGPGLLALFTDNPDLYPFLVSTKGECKA